MFGPDSWPHEFDGMTIVLHEIIKDGKKEKKKKGMESFFSPCFGIINRPNSHRTSLLKMRRE